MQNCRRMKTGVIKKTSDNNESDSDSEWFAEGLSTTMNKSRRISSSKSFHGTGVGERTSERRSREPSGRRAKIDAVAVCCFEFSSLF